MTDLIGLSDLEDRLGHQVENANQALAVIRDVSAVIEAYTGRTFVSAESTLTLQVVCGVVTLPAGPVTAVSSVTSSGSPVDFTWTSGRTLTVSGCNAEVEVTFTHGWEEAPPAIVAVAAQMAGRALGANPAESGIQQESLGSYSVTIGSAAASGPLGILPHERAVLDLYRSAPMPRTINVASWA